MERLKVPAHTPWEDVVGYSRAIKIGNLIEISGTSAARENEIIGGDDPYEQTKYVLQRIQKALQALGADMQHVVRTRIYMTDVFNWQKIGKAHGEVFKEVKPVTTIVEVNSFLSPDILVVIEATAIVD